MKKIFGAMFVMMVMFVCLAMGPQKALAAGKDSRLVRYNWRDKAKLVAMLNEVEMEAEKHANYELVDQRIELDSYQEGDTNPGYTWMIRVVDGDGELHIICYSWFNRSSGGFKFARQEALKSLDVTF